ncbi:Carboxylesterase [Aspergillus insuetus]
MLSSILTVAALVLSGSDFADAALLHGALLSGTAQIADGVIQGNPPDTNGVVSFKGIPFAAPPVGDLRWRSPQPPTPWDDILNATTFGDSCWGAPGLNRGVPQNEDCLKINVWTPAKATEDRLPVMFWIYGGGFQYGNSANPEWDGAVLATKGVIVVTFNYRTSTLGFLSLPDLDKEGQPSGNYGLQDMISALKWVRTNIDKFGGDPSRVTIWGESAGAHAVGLLRSSPLTNGLFAGAIYESGAFWDWEYGSLMTATQASAQGRVLQASLGVTSAEAMRQISPDKLVSALPYDPTSSKPTLFGPSIDSYVLPRPPAAVFASGQQVNVPLLAGVNLNEEYIFQPEIFPTNSPQHFRNTAALWFGNSALPEFNSIYPSGSDSETTTSANRLLGDMTIRQQTWEAAAAQARLSPNVFFYHYNYNSSYSPIPIHTAEIPFVFGTLTPNPLSSVPPGPGDRMFSEQLQSYWANFAKFGNPNGAGCRTGLPHWPSYTGDAKNIQQLESPISVGTYNLDGFQFLKSFRVDGLFPQNWHNLNVSAVP